MYDEDKYRFFKRTIKRYDDTRHLRLVPVVWTVPCIMHMHNRASEKLVVLVLRKGFSIRGSQQKKMDFKDSLEQTMNQAIFGSENNHSTWTCPMTQDRTTCVDISFSDGKAKIAIQNIVLLISDIFCEGKCL